MLEVSREGFFFFLGVTLAVLDVGRKPTEEKRRINKGEGGLVRQSEALCKGWDPTSMLWDCRIKWSAGSLVLID